MECESHSETNCRQKESVNHTDSSTISSSTSILELLQPEAEHDETVIIEGTIDKPEWTTTNITQLLAWIEELRPSMGQRMQYTSKSDMWREIRRRFEANGCFWTKAELITKFGDLIRDYNATLKHNKTVGRDERTFPFKSEFDRIFQDPLQNDEDGLPYFEYWSTAKVNLLLSSLEACLPTAREKHNLIAMGNMWKEIHRRFTDEGYQTTKRQICNKFSGLVRQYRTERSQKRPIKQKKLLFGSRLKNILDQWPKRSGDTNNNFEDNMLMEEDVDDPGVPNNSSEDDGSRINNTGNSQMKKNQSQLVDKQTSHTFNAKASSATCENAQKMKETYYREKREYLKRKIEHLDKKEAHMLRKELLLESVLNCLESKGVKK